MDDPNDSNEHDYPYDQGDRRNQQQNMALKENSVPFWKDISSTFGNNPLVFFELYNEPHTQDTSKGDIDYNIWMNGGDDDGYR